jgi:hypothetical protein
MKVKAVNYVLIMLAILILFGFTVFKLVRVNEQTKAKIPYLVTGERIEYFNLIGEDAAQIDASVFRSDRPALIFIFSRPCNPCQKNFKYWEKMKEILGDRVDFYGIILEGTALAFEFSKKANLNFKIYIPEDVDRFIQAMRIKLNLAQTILYTKNGVKYLKLGDLEGEESVNIINMAKKLI